MVHGGGVVFPQSKLLGVGVVQSFCSKTIDQTHFNNNLKSNYLKENLYIAQITG